MNYEKPELSVLGDAAAVIQTTGTPKKYQSNWDGVTGFTGSTPSYDLDE